MVSILGRHHRVVEAIPEIRRELWPECSYDSIKDRFRRHGLASPAKYLAGPSQPSAQVEEESAPITQRMPPRIDPVERVRAERTHERAVRENRDLVREVECLREQVSLFEKLSSIPIPPIRRRERASGLREGTAVSLFSDIHCEETVLLGSTPADNEYNLEISETRIGRYFDGVVTLVEKERSWAKIRDLILWFGGDLMTGHIHEENLETTELAPIAAMLWIYPLLLGGVKQLLNGLDLEQLSLVCSYGNHGRDTKKPRRATGAHHSYEWGLYQRLAADLASDPRVSVLADPSGHQYVKAYDYDLHFHHGDEVQYWGGVGGITIPLNKAVAQWDKVRRCDYHHFGHFHQYIDTGNIAVNGSMIGYNAYGMSIKATPEPAQQAFYVLDSKRGKTAKSPVWVTERRDDAEEAA